MADIELGTMESGEASHASGKNPMVPGLDSLDSRKSGSPGAPELPTFDFRSLASHIPVPMDGSAFENNEESNSDPNEIVISLYNIHKTYLLGIEGVPALRGVSLEIHRGDFVIIYGTSGGGKTSLLNIIGTIDTPTKGHLSISGKRITPRTTDAELAYLRLKKMGFVFQTFNLLSAMTAIENVEMPMVLLGAKSKAERREHAKQLLEKVGMGHRLDHLPSQLSGGEQQRVTIARAIANSPDILLLDEPTGDLDSRNTLVVMDMLMRLNEDENITMVMVTHDPSLKNFARHIVHMRDGKIQRTEEIPDETRDAAKAKLRQELEALTVGGLQRPTAAATSQNGKMAVATTEVRKPKDYATFSRLGGEYAQDLREAVSALRLQTTDEKTINPNRLPKAPSHQSRSAAGGMVRLSAPTKNRGPSLPSSLSPSLPFGVAGESSNDTSSGVLSVVVTSN